MNRKVGRSPAVLCLCVVMIVACQREPIAPGDQEMENQRERASLSGSQADPTEFPSLARAFALALQNEAVRQRLKTDLARSEIRENKLHLNSYVRGIGEYLISAAASETSGKTISSLAQVLATGAVELHMPVREHRGVWKGGENLLVVWHLDEGIEPVAFDLTGERVPVSEDEPPVTPVIVITPVETNFAAQIPVNVGEESQRNCPVSESSTLSAAIVSCSEYRSDDDQSAGFQAAATLASSEPGTGGVYLTRLKMGETGESWTKGDPEIEVDIIGKSSPGSEGLQMLQCAGEDVHIASAQPGKTSLDYEFDLNDETWDINEPHYKPVLLFDDEQVLASQQSTDGFVVMIWEDDHTRCDIRTDINIQDLLIEVGTSVGSKIAVQVLGGESFRGIISGALQTAIDEFLAGSSDAIKTNDDLIGVVVSKRDLTGIDLTGHPDWGHFTHVILKNASHPNGWAIVENLAAGQEPYYPACLDSSYCGGGPLQASHVTGEAGGPTLLEWSDEKYWWKWYWTDGCNDHPDVDCTYRWYRRDQGESSWTVVTHLPQYAYTAPLDTFYFDLKARVTRNAAVHVDENTETIERQYRVQVRTRPAPPVSAEINGPSTIQPSSTYTWDVTYSGGSGPTTYEWHRAENTGSGSGPWQLVSTKSWYTGSTSNCDGFELKVQVSREYGDPGSDQISVHVLTFGEDGNDCNVSLDPS